MPYHRKYKFLFALVVVFFFGLNEAAALDDVLLLSRYVGGAFDGQGIESMIEPNATVELTGSFSINEQCNSSQGYQLWRTMVHAKGGNVNDLEYLAKGLAGQEPLFTYRFNSGSSGQRNVYWATFYCWTSNAPEVALRSSAVQKWESKRFDYTTLNTSCNFSSPRWSKANVSKGETVELSVQGTSLGCRGMSFSFEIWGGSGGCKGVANRVADIAGTIDSAFPADGSLPLSAAASWVVPNEKEYCFKIRLPGRDNCARPSGRPDECLWSGALRAGRDGGDRDGDGGTDGASVEFPNPLRAKDLRELADALLRWIWWLSIPIAVIMILYAGLAMMTAQGDPKKFQHGRKVLLWAVVGLAVVFIGRGFIDLIKSILELKNG